MSDSTPAKSAVSRRYDVAFVGLGRMGYPMAGHLARAGHRVRVYNRSPEKSSRWVAEYGGRAGHSAAEAARGASFVFACVGNDDDVRAVTLGNEGAFSSMAGGAIFVDHTTTSARLARELATEASRRGLFYVDAPVSGGQQGAEAGTLTIMMGGEQTACERVLPLLRCYASTAKRLGPPGSGQLAKMVNQICIAGLLEALAEGIHFAKRVGLDTEALLEVLSRGAAGSWQMTHRWSTMAEGRFEFGFAVDWMRKDLAIVLEEARRVGAHLPVTALVDQLYSEVQAMGGGRWDTSSLVARLERPHRKS
ncbi:MAG: 3-hydroxyisobutyrate dehydrogenase [Candidatus Binatia bacterium]|nr:MAG: 3-hydroxyisobutyrate dehydrogenase [Candidatus Binatia bacterium]